MSAAWPSSVTAALPGSYRYQRHRPENTLLYQLVADLYPCFVEQMAREGRPLPAYVRAEFEAYLRCGLLEHGFLRVQCTSCHAERLVAFSWPLPHIHVLRGTCESFTSSLAGSAPAAAPGAWPRPRRCWWTTSCRRTRSANGC